MSESATLPFLGAPLRVTGWPREQLRRIIEDAGFTVEVEDAQSYAPPAPDAPPETQLFILAHRGAPGGDPGRARRPGAAHRRRVRAAPRPSARYGRKAS